MRKGRERDRFEGDEKERGNFKTRKGGKQFVGKEKNLDEQTGGK